MLVGGFLGLGLPLDFLQEQLEKLNLKGWKISQKSVEKPLSTHLKDSRAGNPGANPNRQSGKRPNKARQMYLLCCFQDKG